MGLGKLGQLTWCSLGITTHTPQARALKFILCPQAHTFYFRGISANAFLPQFRARVCAARRRLRLFIINDAASPHHYDDNYYYCCDFGLRGESCRRRGSQVLGGRPRCKPAVAAVVRALREGVGVEVNRETKCKLAGARPLALPRRLKVQTPPPPPPKMPAPKEKTAPHSAPGAPGCHPHSQRFSAALARSIFKVKMKNKDIRGDGGRKGILPNRPFPPPPPSQSSSLPGGETQSREWGRLWYRFKFAELS